MNFHSLINIIHHLTNEYVIVQEQCHQKVEVSKSGDYINHTMNIKESDHGNSYPVLNLRLCKNSVNANDKL